MLITATELKLNLGKYLLLAATQDRNPFQSGLHHYPEYEGLQEISCTCVHPG